MEIEKLNKLEIELQASLNELQKIQSAIKEKLVKYSDDKTLKGDELVGWLGEIYGKILFNGKLVDDSNEHDFETSDGRRYSVKTRRGFNKGWTKSSLIRKIEGKDSPTNLLFVHLNNDYAIDRIWSFKWDSLIKNDRLKTKLVRNIMIGWQFSLRVKLDSDNLIIDKSN